MEHTLEFIIPLTLSISNTHKHKRRENSLEREIASYTNRGENDPIYAEEKPRGLGLHLIDLTNQRRITKKNDDNEKTPQGARMRSETYKPICKWKQCELTTCSIHLTSYSIISKWEDKN